MLLRLIPWLSFCLLFAQTPDPNALLQASDVFRGAGLPGVAWTVKVDSLKGEDGEKTYTLELKATSEESIVFWVDPPRVRGRSFLMKGRNMWFSRPGLRKPVPISPRQRLSGQASYGDIASTEYSRDYEAALAEPSSVEGRECYVLDLKAKAKNVTYDRIRYYIEKASGLGIKAEFLTLSGTVLKQARYEYDNQLLIKGKSQPMLSKMSISDALNGEDRTTLSYSQVQVQTFSARDFQQ